MSEPQKKFQLKLIPADPDSDPEAVREVGRAFDEELSAATRNDDHETAADRPGAIAPDAVRDTQLEARLSEQLKSLLDSDNARKDGKLPIVSSPAERRRAREALKRAIAALQSAGGRTCDWMRAAPGACFKLSAKWVAEVIKELLGAP